MKAQNSHGGSYTVEYLKHSAVLGGYTHILENKVVYLAHMHCCGLTAKRSVCRNDRTGEDKIRGKFIQICV